MATEGQRLANRRNAKRSTGPKNSERTRLNALRHGILSKQTLIPNGPIEEDVEVFQELSDCLRQQLAPEGALEELLVDQLIMLTWRWRRVLTFETISAWGMLDEQAENWISTRNQAERALAGLAKERDDDLASVSRDDRLRAYYPVMETATRRFHIFVKGLLKLDDGWSNYKIEEPEVQQVIDAACEKEGISEDAFWQAVEVNIHAKYAQNAKKWEDQLETLQQQRLVARLPQDFDLGRVQRYEAHLSRQFHTALHELQRLQVARLNSQPSAPLAVDVALSSPALEVAD